MEGEGGGDMRERIRSGGKGKTRREEEEEEIKPGDELGWSVGGSTRQITSAELGTDWPLSSTMASLLDLVAQTLVVPDASCYLALFASQSTRPIVAK